MNKHVEHGKKSYATSTARYVDRIQSLDSNRTCFKMNDIHL